jgi:hypothetical protein
LAGINALHDAHNNAAHPSPLEDWPANRCMWTDYRCACPSRRALGAWFRGFKRSLKRYGFRVAIYEVPESGIVHGKSGKQVFFSKSQAVKVGEL